ncbi:taste receptor type 1 member 3 [Colius striatus]|uniref:taste receptor type 1 member 3 n=1 Tax=Colius striatus TaxID=57412 RepID=UPI002B1DDF76|nr:taste receptor type 1 member 3 [Colius striatus]
MVPALLLCLSFGYVAALKPVCLSAQFSRPGDYIIGGLFPFGMDTTNLTARSEPTTVVCERLFVDGLVWALGMKFAIDQINNSTSLLPGVQLGYDMHDTCLEPLAALQPSLLFLTQNGTTGIGVLSNYTDYQPRVTAVIGPHNSDLCLVTAKLFSFLLIPQVSYGASSETFSDTELYPSFYRTVASDKTLVHAVVLLLDEFKWNWIATVGSDDKYGREAQELFSSAAMNHSLCIAFEGLIPTDLQEPEAKNQMEDTIKLINNTQVNVIVIFASIKSAQALLEHSIRMGLSNKVWIGTGAWVLSDMTASIPNIQSIGTVLGFRPEVNTEVPGFRRYVANLFASVQQDKFCQESEEFYQLMGSDVLDTRCKHCDNISLGNISHLLRRSHVKPVYIAVYSVAQALHRALGCTHQACPKAPIRSWQLLHFMNTLPFEVNGQRFKFDQSHSIDTDYKLILWSWRNGTLTYLPVGTYEGSLSINKSLIHFHTADQKEPLECFRNCTPGQLKISKGFHLCCYDCTDCPENTYWNSRAIPTCTPCLQHQWSPGRSTRCFKRREMFLFWSQPLAMVLLTLMAITISLTCLIALLFLKNLDTPLVQAAGGTLNLFALFTLALLSLSCCLYIGRPSSNLCMTQQMAYALCLSGCFSTFFIKSLEIVLVTEFPRCAPTFLGWVTQGRAWLLVALCIFTQCLFCLCYFHLGPDYLVSDYKSLPTEVLLLCNTGSWFAFALLHGYNGCLAFVCFLCTFMVQTSAKRYNIARGITFAILIYFITWIFFIAFFSTLKTVLRSVAQIGATLITSLGILGSYYIPKCYIILLKPDLNTAEYFHNSITEEPEEDSQ